MVGDTRGVESWLSTNSARPRQAVKLWTVMAGHADQATGEVTLTRGEIAAKIGGDKTNVSRIVTELEHHGVVSRRQGGQGAPYTIHPSRLDELVAEMMAEGAGPSNGGVESVATAASGGDQLSGETPADPIAEGTEIESALSTPVQAAHEAAGGKTGPGPGASQVVSATVEINVLDDGKITVSPPFNESFRAGARKLAGDWSGKDKRWTFAADQEARVRELCRQILGAGGEELKHVPAAGPPPVKPEMPGEDAAAPAGEIAINNTAVDTRDTEPEDAAAQPPIAQPDAAASGPGEGFPPFAAWAAEQIATLEAAWRAAEGGRKASLEAAAIAAKRGRRILFGVVLLASGVIAAGWWWTDVTMQAEIGSARAEAKKAAEAASEQARKLVEMTPFLTTLTDERNTARKAAKVARDERDALARTHAAYVADALQLRDAFIKGCVMIPLWQRKMVDLCEGATRIYYKGR